MNTCDIEHVLSILDNIENNLNTLIKYFEKEEEKINYGKNINNLSQSRF